MTTALLALALLVLASIADIVTTLAMLKRGGVERNPLLGKRPTLGKLLAFKAVAVGVCAWLLYLAPGIAPFVAVAAAVTAFVAWRNHTKVMR